MFDMKPALFRLDAESAGMEVAASGSVAHGLQLPSWERTDYRSSGKSAPIALAGSLLIVGSLISALLWLNIMPAPRAKPDLTVVTLSTEPPLPPHRAPAPHQQPSTPRLDQPQIVALPPIVPTAAPQTMATAPQPMPQPVANPTLVVSAAVPAPPAPPPPVTSAGDLSSTMISAKAPTYPLESRRRHEEGTVVLKLLLAADGQVADISIAQSSGSERLDQAALAAVRKWRWKPMMRDGEAVMVQGMVTIPFVLKH